MNSLYIKSNCVILLVNMEKNYDGIHILSKYIENTIKDELAPFIISDYIYNILLKIRDKKELSMVFVTKDFKLISLIELIMANNMPIKSINLIKKLNMDYKYLNNPYIVNPDKTILEFAIENNRFEFLSIFNLKHEHFTSKQMIQLCQSKSRSSKAYLKTL